MDSRLTSKNTQKYGQKKALILSAAVRVFNETGLGDTTITKLAAAADLAKTSITYYFRKKEDIIAACYRDTFAKIEAIITQIDTRLEPAERLRLFIERYVALLHNIDTENVWVSGE